ncbi:MAG: lysine--tRNA ligase [Bdellovibrionaceae bacterium]|nr:lysine--tRNA ligase [Pseudobdellovibrionaceae bacterium]
MQTEEQGTGTATQKENPLRAEKRRKLDQLKAAGIDPFPHNFERSHKLAEIDAKFSHLEAGDVLESEVVTIAGRLMTKRDMGKASFFNIQDQSGAMQGYVKVSELDEQSQTSFKLIDIGDFVGFKGHIFKTKKGQLSVHAHSFTVLCKSLEPLPEKYHGLTDVETKYRHRHLNLIMDTASRKVFETRSKIIREIRNFLDGRGFLEVETPVLQPIYGGASAYPFKTHHRALDMELFMKISPELYLKRLIVGGFEKVYEVGKNFRNEGIDRSHNPEFSMLEYYEAYTDYNYQMQQFEDLVNHLVQSVKGTLKFEYNGKEIDFTGPWRRLSVFDGIKEYAGVDVEAISDDELFKTIKSKGSTADKPASRGEMIMELFELTVEEHLWNPTFVIDFPKEVSPLTKSHRSKPGLVERFEPMAAKMEIGNAYTELNDPVDQRDRLMEQEKKRVVDEEAQPMDEDFLHAIETGMPPTGGVGIGVERIVMILTNQPSIRDIILFPTMKHKS